MSEDRTKDLPDARSFEERVFARFDAMEKHFDAMEKRFDTLERNFKAEILEVKIVINEMNARLITLEDKVEHRLYDTKPIWEGVQAQLNVMQGQLTDLQGQVAEVKDKVGLMDEKLGVLNNEILDLRGESVRFKKRITQLEQQQIQ